MKALAHRRLTPVLAMLCVAAAIWLAVLMSGAGRRAHWRDPLPIATLPAAPHPMTEMIVPPLDAMKVAWERPLFEPTRRMVSIPAPAAETPAIKLSGLVLTGTVLAGPLQVALIKDASGKDLRIPVSGSYEGWMLVSLESRRAVFRHGEATDEVTFPPRDNKPPGADLALGTMASQPVGATTQSAPMMTLEAERRTPASAPLDDTSARQAKLEALKDVVARRRAESSGKAEAIK